MQTISGHALYGLQSTAASGRQAAVKTIRFAAETTPPSGFNCQKNLRFWSKPVMLSWDFISMTLPSGTVIDNEKWQQVGVHMREGEAQNKKLNFESAKRSVEKALGLMEEILAPLPENYREFNTEQVKQLLAHLYFKTGQDHAAERVVKELLAMEDNHIMSRWSFTNNLASVYKQQGRMQEAKTLLETLIGKNPYTRPPRTPDDIDGFDSRRMQEINYAENFACWALGDMMLNLADLYRQTGEPAKAEQICEKLLDEMPDLPINSGNARGYMDNKSDRLIQLADLYDDLRKPEQAALLREKADLIRGRTRR